MGFITEDYSKERPCEEGTGKDEGVRARVWGTREQQG